MAVYYFEMANRLGHRDAPIYLYFIFSQSFLIQQLHHEFRDFDINFNTFLENLLAIGLARESYLAFIQIVHETTFCQKYYKEFDIDNNQSLKKFDFLNEFELSINLKSKSYPNILTHISKLFTPHSYPN